MGLAASQARFLGITARKNACELRTMEIAQERLSVSNQLSQASQNYMNSLSATKLIWNPEYTDDFIYSLDYASMSRPSAFNEYQLQFLTNTKGQAVLDSSFYNALCNTGVQFKDENGTAFDFDKFTKGGIGRTTENFKIFIQALADQGIITEAQKVKMYTAIDYQGDTNDGTAYSCMNGFGKNMSTMAEIYSTDLMGLCEYIDQVTNIGGEDFLNELYETYGSNPIAPTPYDNAKNVIDLLDFDYFKSINTVNDGIGIFKSAEFPQPTNEWLYDRIYGSDHYHHNPDCKDYNIHPYSDFNLADLLGRDDLALVGYTASDNFNYTSYVNKIDKFVETLMNISRDFFDYDGAADEAALQATQKIIEKLYKDSNDNLRVTDAGYYYSYDSGSGIGTYTGGIPDYVNYCVPVKQIYEYTDGDGYTYSNNNAYGIVLSLSNLAQAFFTEYENQRSKGTSGYDVVLTTGYVNDCNLISMDENYIYDYIDAGTLPVSGEISQVLNYYSQMFNQICTKGFVYNSAVDDSENLQNMLKNGYLAVNTIGDDNYFYQYDYMAFTKGHGCFKEVTDENAVARAEAEYKTKQAQLNAKEEELSVDLQSIEAELAALSTEYDTVKNLISKSVQKDFTTCGG